MGGSPGLWSGGYHLPSEASHHPGCGRFDIVREPSPSSASSGRDHVDPCWVTDRQIRDLPSVAGVGSGHTVDPLVQVDGSASR